MSREATGQVIPTKGERRGWSIRFRAYGRREYLTLYADEGWTEAKVRDELMDILVLVKKGVWKRPERHEAVALASEPTFEEFASQWLDMRRQEGLRDRTMDDYEWAFRLHLTPFFRRRRLSEITAQEVDRYKVTKRAEGVLSSNTINKTITRLSQVLATAADYGLIPANPATGRKRRLKGTKPQRPRVEPEQLPMLLEAAEGLLPPRGRPLLAVLAGAGLRISEALALERRDLNLERAELRVRESKTDAGARIVHLTAALLDELIGYYAAEPWRQPTDPLFCTRRGKRDNRNNVRQRLVVPAAKAANVKLAELGIDPIGENLGPHGLRHTYASLRCAAGDDPAYVAEQTGHEDARFTLNVYTHAIKRRHRLTEAERVQYDHALAWAQWAPTGTKPDLSTDALSTEETESGARPLS